MKKVLAFIGCLISANVLASPECFLNDLELKPTQVVQELFYILAHNQMPYLEFAKKKLTGDAFTEFSGTNGAAALYKMVQGQDVLVGKADATNETFREKEKTYRVYKAEVLIKPKNKPAPHQHLMDARILCLVDEEGEYLEPRECWISRLK